MASIMEIADHPRFGRGDALVELQNYIEGLRAGADIVEFAHLDSERKDNGTLHRFGFVTANGYAYNGNIAIPDELSSDIPVLATCAWRTSPRGHNEHTALKLMEDGLATIIVGNEGSYRPRRLPRPKAGMSLGGTAAAALNFSHKVTEDNFAYLLDPTKRTTIGESKGGMEGMGLVSLAEFFEQDVLMADFTAACIPRKITLNDAKEFSGQIRSEPVELARLGGRLAFKLVLHYPATIDPHPYARIHQDLKGFAVFSGEAGDLARLINARQILHMTTFSGDFASMRNEWEEIFKEHANVKITPLKGSHLTIADPETLAYVRARQQAFRQLYAAHNGELSSFTGSDVFGLAHELVDQYRSPEPQGVVNKMVRFLLGTHSSVEAA